jgi:hypothetical protein
MDVEHIEHFCCNTHTHTHTHGNPEQQTKPGESKHQLGGLMEPAGLVSMAPWKVISSSHAAP